MNRFAQNTGYFTIGLLAFLAAASALLTTGIFAYSGTIHLVETLRALIRMLP